MQVENITISEIRRRGRISDSMCSKWKNPSQKQKEHLDNIHNAIRTQKQIAQLERLWITPKIKIKNGTEAIYNGRCFIYLDGHLSGRRCIRRAWLVIEKYFGRLPIYSEITHHNDGNELNDKITNLILFKNQSAHARFHKLGDAGVKLNDIVFDGRMYKYDYRLPNRP